MTRFIGRGARLDRVHQVSGMLLALATATAISATVGTVSILAGGVIGLSGAPQFWRTWWLGDTAGGLVALPLLLTWAPDPVAVWRSVRSWDGAPLVVLVTGLAVIAVTVHQPVLYMIFPALIWAAFRFGPPGATLATAIAAGVVVGVTAHDAGPFSSQPIDDRALSTQVFVVVAALTTLFLSAMVSERQQAALELAESKHREGERAREERQRIARDLHDSVSQALFSTALQTRVAQKTVAEEGIDGSGRLSQALGAIDELTKDAQSEMRTLIFDLPGEAVEHGLVAALKGHGARLGAHSGVAIHVYGPSRRVVLPPPVETHLYGIGCEAMANTVKHAGARSVQVHVDVRNDGVALEIRDDGSGFDLAETHPGHFGIESMRSRAEEIGGLLTIESAPGEGTVVRVEVP